jgi:hypothetical protein
MPLQSVDRFTFCAYVSALFLIYIYNTESIILCEHICVCVCSVRLVCNLVKKKYILCNFVNTFMFKVKLIN